MALNSIGYAVGLSGTGRLLLGMCTPGGAAFALGGWGALTCASMIMFEVRDIEKRAELALAPAAEAEMAVLKPRGAKHK
jgi:hypothetical protein